MLRSLCLVLAFVGCVAALGPCGSGRRMCVGVKKCVSLGMVCDGRNDCGDYSDEWDCEGFTCPPNKFKCTRGGCIPSRWKCDDYPDCGDSSDEANCPNSAQGGQTGGQQGGTEGGAQGGTGVQQQAVDPWADMIQQQIVP